VRKVFKDLTHCWDGNTLSTIWIRLAAARAKVVAGIKAAQLVESVCSNRSRTIGRAIHCWIVDNNDLAFACRLNVQFEGISATGQAAFKSDQCVLWREAGTTTMSKEQWPVVNHIRAPQAVRAFWYCAGCRC